MSELGSQCRSVLMLPNGQQGAEILVSSRSQIVRKLMRKWLITSCGRVAQLSWIQSKSQFFFFCENENVSKMIISTNRSNQDILPRGECCIAKLGWRRLDCDDFSQFPLLEKEPSKPELCGQDGERGCPHPTTKQQECETFRLDWRRSAASLKQWIIKKNPLNAHKKKNQWNVKQIRISVWTRFNQREKN